MELLDQVLYIYAFIIGCCIASFVNVIVYRLPKEESFVKGRSYCPTCNHTLAWYDLLPVLSYIIVRGKCRYCRAKIPVKDTLLEVFGGMMAMFCYHHYGVSWDMILVFVIIMIFVAISFIDLETMTIPDGLLIAFFIITMFMCFLHPEVAILDRIIGFFSISVFMIIVNRIVADSFGGGDIKFIAVAGLLLGYKATLLAAFISIILAGMYASYLLITKKAKTGAHIAFGPYLAIGILLSLFYHEAILSFYLSLFTFT